MLQLLAATLAFAGPIYDRTQTAPNVVWVGADFTATHLFVPETFDDPSDPVLFNPGGGLRDAVRRYEKPDDAWKDLVVEWNQMLQHDLEDSLEMTIQRDLVIDLAGPAGPTQTRKPPFFESQYEARNVPQDLDPDVIAGMVKKYRLKSRDGLGLVFIYERGSALDKEACVWPTWFDVQKKTIISTQRVCEKPGGQTFRNYWYTPMLKIGQDVVKGLKKGEI